MFYKKLPEQELSGFWRCL